VRTALRALPGNWNLPKGGAAKVTRQPEPEAKPTQVYKPAQEKTVSATRVKESDSELNSADPAKAAFYGPSACIATFKSPAGSCIVQTRCVNADITDFNIGVTCLDKSGDYIRYLYGRNSFEPEETFDTRVECELCLGVSEDPDMRQLKGVVPKQLVEDVNALKIEVRSLKEQVNEIMIAKGKEGSAVGESAGGETEKENPNGRGAEDTGNSKNNKKDSKDSKDAGTAPGPTSSQQLLQQI